MIIKKITIISCLGLFFLIGCNKSFPTAEKLTAQQMVDIMVKVKGAEWVEREVLNQALFMCSAGRGSFKNKPKELDCFAEKNNKNYEVFRNEIVPFYERNILNRL